MPKYFDNPHLMETFCDVLGENSFDGQTLKITLCVVRREQAKSTLIEKVYPSCRLAMTPACAKSLVNTVQRLLNAYEESGKPQNQGPKH